MSDDFVLKKLIKDVTQFYRWAFPSYPKVKNSRPVIIPPPVPILDLVPQIVILSAFIVIQSLGSRAE